MTETEQSTISGADNSSNRMATENLIWNDACLAADIFVQCMAEENPSSAGILVKAQFGPVRDLWLRHLTQALSASTKLFTVPNLISTDRLIGGLDLTTTLAEGRKCFHQGLLAQAHKNVVILPSANLLQNDVLNHVIMTMDSQEVRVERDGASNLHVAQFGVIAFDESSGTQDEDATVHPALIDRLMLHVDLNVVSIRGATGLEPIQQLEPRRVSITNDQIEQICALTSGFGLESLRPALQAVKLAKRVCQLDGRDVVSELDIQISTRLSLLNRAIQLPASQEPTDQEQQTEQSQEDQSPEQLSPPQQNEEQVGETSGDMPKDIDIEGITTAIPAGMLSLLKAKLNAKPKNSKSGRRGISCKNAQRGRPLASRRGNLRSGHRLDGLATLRAAAPWQKLYGDLNTGFRNCQPIRIRRSDLHVRQYKQRSETSSIFVVDASGSTALNRLAEAKGAVELLLGASYARRDHVALVSFRGRDAEVLLPPTRALVRAKRALAALPGGGGTPLANGLSTALRLAEDELRKGRSPSLILLTDGSANIDANGVGNRPQAAADAQSVARRIESAGFPVILIDVGRQPRAQAKDLAATMDAHYVPMPIANARSLSEVVRAHQ